jgi:uncharacterized protein with HEPN domain
MIIWMLCLSKELQKKEFMFDKELVSAILNKILITVERVINQNSNISSADYYALSPLGMERLESTCMLLIAIGESVKGIDKIDIHG